MQTTFIIETRGQGLYEFTTDIAAWLSGFKHVNSGLC